MTTKIYVLVAYAKDGRIADLGFSDDLEATQKEIGSKETEEQLKELGFNDVEFKIRDNFFPTNYYPLEVQKC